MCGSNTLSLNGGVLASCMASCAFGNLGSRQLLGYPEVQLLVRITMAGIDKRWSGSYSRMFVEVDGMNWG